MGRVIKNKDFFLSPLQKHILTSMLLALTLFLDFAYERLGIAKIGNHMGSYVKIAILPLILIGFLLGWRNSFWCCFFYSLFHLFKGIASGILEYMETLSFSEPQKLIALILDYLLVDVTYSLSALFYSDNLKYFDSHCKIWLNLLIVFLLIFVFKFFSSYFIWIAKRESIPPFLDFNTSNKLIFCLCYNLMLMITNFLISGIFFSFFNPRIKLYLKSQSLK